MFTGIIEDIGILQALDRRGDSLTLAVESRLQRVNQMLRRNYSRDIRPMGRTSKSISMATISSLI